MHRLPDMGVHFDGTSYLLAISRRTLGCSLFFAEQPADFQGICNKGSLFPAVSFAYSRRPGSLIDETLPLGEGLNQVEHDVCPHIEIYLVSKHTMHKKSSVHDRSEELVLGDNRCHWPTAIYRSPQPNVPSAARSFARETFSFSEPVVLKLIALIFALIILFDYPSSSRYTARQTMHSLTLWLQEQCR